MSLVSRLAAQLAPKLKKPGANVSTKVAEAPPETGGRSKTTTPTRLKLAPPVATPTASSEPPVRADLAVRLGVKQCRAIDADTGRRCCRLVHAEGTIHRTPRGDFFNVAAPNQTVFGRDAAFVEAANSQPKG